MRSGVPLPSPSALYHCEVVAPSIPVDAAPSPRSKSSGGAPVPKLKDATPTRGQRGATMVGCGGDAAVHQEWRRLADSSAKVWILGGSFGYLAGIITYASNNKPSQNTGPALVNNTDKLHPTLISTISMEELNEATKNFNDDVLIGQGPYAKCFLGVLKDGQKFAVKKLHASEDTEIEVPTILRMCYHDNVVQFLGCFLEGETRVLAYEYAPRGSLHDILHGKQGIRGARPGPPLSWSQRVKIAVSAAKGLEFLHEKGDLPIIHGNIKSSNILLFDNDVAKIGDIGVLILQTTNSDDDLAEIETIWGPRCSSGWESQAPECSMDGEYSTKSDVYSFGVVLLELLTGRNDYTTPREQGNLVTWAIPRLTRNKVVQCIDPRLRRQYRIKAVSKMAAVAVQCLQNKPELRPEMNLVVEALSWLLDSE